MKWLQRQNLSTWLLVVVVTGNLILLALFWNRMAVPVPAHADSTQPGARAPVRVIVDELAMDEQQALRVTALHDRWRTQSRECNDSLVLLKSGLAEALYEGEPDTAPVTRTTEAIGRVQARLELLRFRYFRDLLSVCSPEQGAKLRPMIRDLFRRKPPAEETGKQKKRADAADRPQPPRPHAETHTPGPPPGVEEKLARYTAQLDLAPDQASAVRAVLLQARERGELLRRSNSPDDVIRQEKEKIRADEDTSILQILREDQRRAFDRMIRNRRKETPRR